MPFKDLVPQSVRRLVPNPLKQLPWRIGWLRGTKTFASSPVGAFGRLGWWTLSELFNEELVFVTPGGRKFTTMRNNFVGMFAYVGRDYENDLLEFVRSSLAPGSTFCDVGANIGIYTIEAACRVGRSGRVFSFEAHPATYAYLRKNISEHNLNNVTAINAAVGDQQGQIGIVSVQGDSGSSDVSLADRKTQTMVPLTTLDATLGQHGVHNIDYLKIDVEGFELHVLRGAEIIIENSRKLLVQTEIDLRHLKRFNISVSELVSFFAERGFSPHRLGRSGALEHVDPSSIAYGDYIWMRPHS